MELQEKPKIAIAGASGQFGRRMLYCLSQSYNVIALSHRSPIQEPKRASKIVGNFDITNKTVVERIVAKLKELGVRTLINCVGDVSIDISESTRGDKDSYMYRVNAHGAGNLAGSCRKNAIKLVHFSTEYVFDGCKPYSKKYTEEEKPNTDVKAAPTWYGITKALGEKKVLRIYKEGSVIIRFSQFQSPAGGLFFKTLRELSGGQSFTRSSDQLISPITDKTASHAFLLIEHTMHERNFNGIIHVSATDAHTVYDTCLLLAKAYGKERLARRYIIPIPLKTLVEKGEHKIERPLNSILDVRKFQKEFGNSILHTVAGEIKLFQSLYRDLL